MKIILLLHPLCIFRNLQNMYSDYEDDDDHPARIPNRSDESQYEIEIHPETNSRSVKTFNTLKSRVKEEVFNLDQNKDVESVDLADIDDLDSDNEEDKKKILKAKAQVSKDLRQGNCKLIHRPTNKGLPPKQANLTPLEKITYNEKQILENFERLGKRAKNLTNFFHGSR